MSSTFLDLRTLSFVLVLITIFLSIVMFFIWRIHKVYPGFNFWSISNLMVAAGFFLLGLRGMIPDFFTIILGNTLACGSILIAYEGNRRFLGLPDSRRFSMTMTAALIGGLTYFVYADNILLARIILTAIFSVVLSLRCAFLFKRHSPKRSDLIYRSVSASYIAFGILMVLRTILTYFFSDIKDLYSPDWIQSTIFVTFVIFAIIWTFGYVILNNERLQQELKTTQLELEKLATTDFLTGINNNRNFFEAAAKEIGRARRFQHSLTVVMFDIDYFKQINDTYGHAAGDQVLVEIAAICQRILRNIDVFGRLGGEEFAFLLPHTGNEGGKTVAEYARTLIEEKNFEFAGRIFKVTASFGVCELAGTDKEIKQVLDRADNFLYEAKRRGRNQTACGTENVVYQELAAA